MSILTWIKKVQAVLDNLSPETRNLIIIFLFGYIFYSQITDTTKRIINYKFQEEISYNKQAEKYSIEASVEVNNQVQLIAEKEKDAFNVLILNYHNNTQSLQGYKYLYLSCLTEAPKCLDTPLLKQQWNRIDYIYYADELNKIHKQGYVCINDTSLMKHVFPKLYHLVKASDAQAATFIPIEGHDTAIGMIVILYNTPRDGVAYNRSILPCIQKLATILDYENNVMK